MKDFTWYTVDSNFDEINGKKIIETKIGCLVEITNPHYMK